MPNTLTDPLPKSIVSDAKTSKKNKKDKAQTEEAKPKSYAAFLTRPGANEGVKFDLVNPDGEDSGFWIRIVGEDSDIFRKGHAEFLRAALKDADETNADALFEQGALELMADCIIAWNFEEEATRAEKVSLLRDAPQIKDKVNEIITKQSLFIKKKLTP